MIRNWLAVVGVLGCGGTAPAPDGSVPDRAADLGVETDSAVPGSDGMPEAGADLGLDLAADARPDVAADAEVPWVAPPTCAGLKINGVTPFAVLDATGGIPRGPGGPSCEGDVPYTVAVNRLLCGSIPADPTVIANALGPYLTRPLMQGERALLTVTQFPCPVYKTPVYDVIDRRDVGAWNELAAMFRPDGGP
jgi:hypothetical protein